MACNFSINDAYELAKTEMMSEDDTRDRPKEFKGDEEAIKKMLNDLIREQSRLTREKSSAFCRELQEKLYYLYK